MSLAILSIPGSQILLLGRRMPVALASKLLRGVPWDVVCKGHSIKLHKFQCQAWRRKKMLILSFASNKFFSMSVFMD